MKYIPSIDTLKYIGIFVLIFMAIFFRDYRIGSKTWKNCGKNAFLGNTTTFDYSYSRFMDDNLYQNGEAVAVLGTYRYNFIEDIIIITSVDGKEKGTYCSQ